MLDADTNALQAAGQELAMAHERARGRRPVDVSQRWEGNDIAAVLGWSRPVNDVTCYRPLSADVLSYDADERPDRLIKVVAPTPEDPLLVLNDLTLATACSFQDHWWLYVAMDCCGTTPSLVEVPSPYRLPWRRLFAPTAKPPLQSYAVWAVPINEAVATATVPSMNRTSP